MKPKIAMTKLAAAALALLFITSGCAAAPVVNTSATVAPASAAPTVAATASPAATTAPAATATATPAPSVVASQDTTNTPAFKLYNLVKLGMTKDEADKATGQVGTSTNDYDKQNNTVDYIDDQGCGVKVSFNDQMKAYYRMAFSNDTANIYGSLTSKPVTEDQSKQIKAGMSYSAVVELLSGAGIITSETADKTDCTSNIARTMDWGNKELSYIEVEFLPDNTVKAATFVPYEAE
jgi:hypothetical protein